MPKDDFAVLRTALAQGQQAMIELNWTQAAIFPIKILDRLEKEHNELREEYRVEMGAYEAAEREVDRASFAAKELAEAMVAAEREVEKWIDLEHKMMERATEAEEKLEDAVREVERLREALRFYSNERRYEIDEDGCAVDWQEYDGDPILQDGGAIARAALDERTENESST